MWLDRIKVFAGHKQDTLHRYRGPCGDDDAKENLNKETTMNVAKAESA